MFEQAVLIAALMVIAGMLVWDARRSPDLSPALWLAVIWVVLLASRPIAQWFDPQVGGIDADPMDGSPLDRTVILSILLCACIILLHRKLEWQRWFLQNKWVFALVVFAGLSVLWSEYTEVTAKRWIRGLGSILIALLVLSERDPTAAVTAVIRRSSLLLIPLSIVIIKYFRVWGVYHNSWTGEEYVSGVTTDKNALGRYCMTVALFAIWSLRSNQRPKRTTGGLIPAMTRASIFIITLWLLLLSKSSTSLACLIIGVLLLVALDLSWFRGHPQRLIGGLFFVVGALIPVALLIDVPALAVAALGRDLTLTGRVFIWQDLFSFDTNPIIGIGYDSFWLGRRLEWFLRMHQVNAAHNGYLEIYLSLGVIGLLVFLTAVYGALVHALKSFSTDPVYGRLRIAVISVFLIYNITETATLLTSFMFFIFLLVGMEPPPPLRHRAFVDSPVRLGGSTRGSR